MARRLRLQFPGAMYHVINRGNYQHEVFASVGAARAFERTLGEAAARHRWRVHAYVVLSNHFHLALETPEPNLVEGMHWLLTTFVTRHNRFRRRQGHLFQGRYKSILIQDTAHLSRVVDYIHLNPVRASLVPITDLAEFRPSSLWHFARSHAPSWLVATSGQPSSEARGDELSPASLLSRLSKVASRLRPQGHVMNRDKWTRQSASTPLSRFTT
jgi:putative transposase